MFVTFIEEQHHLTQWKRHASSIVKGHQSLIRSYAKKRGDGYLRRGLCLHHSRQAKRSIVKKSLKNTITASASVPTR
ncbi:hypothetical protein [Microscilla marina]|uniref:hypothetical protein n=1 Tax=Microscilla marina TaxID=1027 RepID=UPI0018DCA2DC|nr:hypothetical protein [Microscilla marina]